jgi:lambda family phage portal protein
MGNFGPINPEVAAAGAQLRARARHQAVNHPLIASGVRNLATALTGTGIVPTSRAKSKAKRRAFAKMWEAFTRQADADGRTDFAGLQAQIARGVIVDGEAFLQILDGEDGLPWLRLIPPELVDESMTRPVDGGGFIVNGIEFAADGTRVAYWVFPAKPTDLFQTYTAPVRIPASEMLHIFEPIAAGQVRGVSWLAPIVLPASEFDQLCDALLTGTKIAAMFAGFLTNQNSTDGADPFDGEAQPSLEPGTLQRLSGGWDIKFSTPGQAQQTGEYLKAMIRQLAAGLGVPSHWLDGDLTGANYSSLRAGLLPVRARCEAVQYLTLVPQFLDPVWREVFPDDADGADWLPPAWAQVDPLKQVEADAAELAAGLTSRRKLIAARGWTVEDLDSEIAADTFTPRTPAAPAKPKEGDAE